MKVSFLIIILTFCLGSEALFAQEGTGGKVVLNVKIKDLPAGEQVYYAPQRVFQTKKDSILSTAGGFSLSIDIPEGEYDVYSFQIGYKPADVSIGSIDAFRGYGIYLEPGEVNITGDGPYFAAVEVTSNSKFIQDKNDLDKYIESYTRPLIAKMVKKRKGGMPDLEENFKKNKFKIEAYKRWAGLHPALNFTASIVEALSDLPADYMPKDSVLVYYKKLLPEAKNNAAARRLKMKYDRPDVGVPGSMALDFTQPDTAGKPVSLKDFRGKYVLVDFWASWCGPCRAENPNVIKAYEAYKDRGFTVLGISLDKPGKKEDWLKAIQEDGLKWTQVADLLPYNKAAELYNVRTIPSNFLIDPQGKIVARNLRGADLENKLAELLKK